MATCTKFSRPIINPDSKTSDIFSTDTKRTLSKDTITHTLWSSFEFGLLCVNVKCLGTPHGYRELISSEKLTSELKKLIFPQLKEIEAAATTTPATVTAQTTTINGKTPQKGGGGKKTKKEEKEATPTVDGLFAFQNQYNSSIAKTIKNFLNLPAHRELEPSQKVLFTQKTTGLPESKKEQVIHRDEEQGEEEEEEEDDNLPQVRIVSDTPLANTSAGLLHKLRQTIGGGGEGEADVQSINMSSQPPTEYADTDFPTKVAFHMIKVPSLHYPESNSVLLCVTPLDEHYDPIQLIKFIQSTFYDDEHNPKKNKVQLRKQADKNSVSTRNRYGSNRVFNSPDVNNGSFYCENDFDNNNGRVPKFPSITDNISSVLLTFTTYYHLVQMTKIYKELLEKRSKKTTGAANNDVMDIDNPEEEEEQAGEDEETLLKHLEEKIQILRARTQARVTDKYNDDLYRSYTSELNPYSLFSMENAIDVLQYLENSINGNDNEEMQLINKMSIHKEKWTLNFNNHEQEGELPIEERIEIVRPSSLQEEGEGRHYPIEIYKYPCQLGLPWMRKTDNNTMVGLCGQLFPWVNSIYNVPQSVLRYEEKMLLLNSSLQRNSSSNSKKKGSLIEKFKLLSSSFNDKNSSSSSSSQMMVNRLDTSPVTSDFNDIGLRKAHIHKKGTKWNGFNFDIHSSFPNFVPSCLFPLSKNHVYLNFASLNMRRESMERLKPKRTDLFGESYFKHGQLKVTLSKCLTGSLSTSVRRLLVGLTPGRPYEERDLEVLNKWNSDQERVCEKLLPMLNEMNSYSKIQREYAWGVTLNFSDMFFTRDSLRSLRLSTAFKTMTEYYLRHSTLLQDDSDSSASSPLLIPATYGSFMLGHWTLSPTEDLFGSHMEHVVRAYVNLLDAQGMQKIKCLLIAYPGIIVGHMDIMRCMKSHLLMTGPPSAGKTFLLKLIESSLVPGIGSKKAIMSHNSLMVSEDKSGLVLLLEEGLDELSDKTESAGVNIYKTILSDGNVVKSVCNVNGENGFESLDRFGFVRCCMVACSNLKKDDYNKAVRARTHGCLIADETQRNGMSKIAGTLKRRLNFQNDEEIPIYSVTGLYEKTVDHLSKVLKQGQTPSSSSSASSGGSSSSSSLPLGVYIFSSVPQSEEDQRRYDSELLNFSNKIKDGIVTMKDESVSHLYKNFTTTGRIASSSPSHSSSTTPKENYYDEFKRSITELVSLSGGKRATNEQEQEVLDEYLKLVLKQPPQQQQQNNHPHSNVSKLYADDSIITELNSPSGIYGSDIFQTYRVKEARENFENYMRMEGVVGWLTHYMLLDGRMSLSSHLFNCLVPLFINELELRFPFIKFDNRTPLKMNTLAVNLTIIRAFREEFMSPINPWTGERNEKYFSPIKHHYILDMAPRLFMTTNIIVSAFTSMADEFVSEWYCKLYHILFSFITKTMQFFKALLFYESLIKSTVPNSNYSIVSGGESSGSTGGTGTGTGTGTERKMILNIPVCFFLKDERTSSNSIFSAACFLKEVKDQKLWCDMNYVVIARDNTPNCKDFDIRNRLISEIQSGKELNVGKEGIEDFLKHLQDQEFITAKWHYNVFDTMDYERSAEKQRKRLDPCPTLSTLSVEIIPTEKPFKILQYRTVQVNLNGGTERQILMCTHALLKIQHENIITSVVKDVLQKAATRETILTTCILKGSAGAGGGGPSFSQNDFLEKVKVGYAPGIMHENNHRLKKTITVNIEDPNLQSSGGSVNVEASYINGDYYNARSSILTNLDADINELDRNMKKMNLQGKNNDELMKDYLESSKVVMESFRKNLQRELPSSYAVDIELDLWSAYKHLVTAHCCELRLQKINEPVSTRELKTKGLQPIPLESYVLEYLHQNVPLSTTDMGEDEGEGVGGDTPSQNYINGKSGQWRPLRALTPSVLAERLFYLKWKLAATSTVPRTSSNEASDHSQHSLSLSSQPKLNVDGNPVKFSIREILPLIVWKSAVLEAYSKFGITTPSMDFFNEHPDVTYHSSYLDSTVPRYVLKDLIHYNELLKKKN